MPRPLTPSPEFLDSIGKKPDGTPKAKDGDEDKPKSAATVIGTFVAIVVGVVWWAAMARALGTVVSFKLCPDGSGTNVLYDLLCTVDGSQAWQDTMAVWEVVADTMDWLPGSAEGTTGMLGLVLAPLVAGLAIVASGFVAAAGMLFSALDNASDGPLEKVFWIGLAFLGLFPVDATVSTLFTSLVYLRPFAPGAADRAKLTPGAVALVIFGLLCAVVNAVVDSTTLSSSWRTVLWLAPLLLSLVFSLLA